MESKSKIRRDKEGHHILTKRTIHLDNLIIINLYAPSIGTHNFIKQTLLDIKGHMARYYNSKQLQYPHYKSSFRPQKSTKKLQS
jgi:hypothetical protein